MSHEDHDALLKQAEIEENTTLSDEDLEQIAAGGGKAGGRGRPVGSWGRNGPPQIIG